ncbi:hypothetical protein BH23BAC3_BH23BAC3_17560 [soil metagenome]
MYTYAEQRPAHLRQHMIEHFDLGETVELIINKPIQQGGSVQLNSMVISEQTPGIRILNDSWSGNYFENNPVTLIALPESGYRFSHWSGDVEDLTESEKKRAELTLSLGTSRNLTPNFEAASPVETDDPQLLAYWVFTDDLPNDTTLTDIEPTIVHSDLSSNGLEPVLTYQAAISPYPPTGGTSGIMDRVNDPTALNYQPGWNNDITFEDSDMRGIRARNPSLVGEVESSIIFQLPTTGYMDTEFAFAVKRTGSGQQKLIVEYSTEETEAWTQENIDPVEIELFEEYITVNFSFEDVPQSDDNPEFRIRFRFGGDSDIREGDSGNVRFNNISLAGVMQEFTTVLTDRELPAEHTLHQNYPNPFNPVTTVNFELSQPKRVQLDVYDMLGRRVASIADGFKEAGTHSVSFDASVLSSGVYIYRLKTDSAELHRRMTLIK